MSAISRAIPHMLFRPRASFKLGELLLPGTHSPHIRRHRAQLITNRVKLVSALFAVLTPAWIAVDLGVFAWSVSSVLAVLRLSSTAALAALARWPARRAGMGGAYLMLGLMLAIPPIFYLAAHPFVLGADGGALVRVVAKLYGLLPFIVVAGLSVFPLTALEVVAAALPVLVTVVIGSAQQSAMSLEETITSIWLMLMVIGVSAFSGMSQLHYMIVLINQAAKDPLTGAFTRRLGEESLDLQFRIAMRTALPLSLAFVDIDNFKAINDRYGHEQGDRVLRNVGDALRRCLRQSDILIRWGGEEFLILLPNTSAADCRPIMERLGQVGLGTRPDGSVMTASIGLAEHMTDGCTDWEELVELADTRMYEAKRSGKNRYVGPNGAGVLQAQPALRK